MRSANHRTTLDWSFNTKIFEGPLGERESSGIELKIAALSTKPILLYIFTWKSWKSSCAGAEAVVNSARALHQFGRLVAVAFATRWQIRDRVPLPACRT